MPLHAVAGGRYSHSKIVEPRKLPPPLEFQ